LISSQVFPVQTDNFEYFSSKGAEWHRIDKSIPRSEPKRRISNTHRMLRD
jgi:hypothetical protein